ncbi:MAG: STAS domain-containing protein [Halothiobacillaceae bacterium]
MKRGGRAAYTVQRTSDGTVRVRGRLDFESLAGRDAGLPEALGAGGQVCLDELARVDSAGLAQLIEWRARAARAGRRLEYVGLPDQARQMIRAYGLQALFADAPDDGRKPEAT